MLSKDSVNDNPFFYTFILTSVVRRDFSYPHSALFLNHVIRHQYSAGKSWSFFQHPLCKACQQQVGWTSNKLQYEGIETSPTWETLLQMSLDHEDCTHDRRLLHRLQYKT